MIQNRIVIDTNVCLDLFVFHDPRWNALKSALKDGSVQAVTRSDCRTEWLKVLDYRHLPLSAETRPDAIAEFDSLIECIDLPADPAAVKLPVCSDPDDQKFLEIARDAGARALITKDKALLKLARRNERAGMFAILTPEKWLASG